MLRLAHSNFLYLLTLVPVFIAFLVLFLIWRKKALGRFGEYNLILRLIPEYSTGRLIFKFVLLMAAFAFLVLALADPQT